MNTLVSKLQQLELQLSAQYGPIALFALLKREDSHDNWHIVISAEWAASDYKHVIGMISNQLRRALTQEEFSQIGAIILLNSQDPLVKAMTAEFNVEHGDLRVHDRMLDGIGVTHGVIITSSQESSAVAA